MKSLETTVGINGFTMIFGLKTIGTNGFAMVFGPATIDVDGLCQNIITNTLSYYTLCLIFNHLNLAPPHPSSRALWHVLRWN